MVSQIPTKFMMRSRIAGVGMAVPSQVVYNRTFLPGTRFDKVEEIFQRCGVQRRQNLGPGETTGGIATEAAERALTMAGMSAGDLDLIICACTLPEDLGFGVSSTVQINIGARQAAVFDIRAACTGFVKGLEIAVNLIKTGAYSNTLLIGVETPSRMYGEAPEVAMLFGDGAGAAILTRSEEPQPWVFVMNDDGFYSDLISRPFSGDTGVVFRGYKVFEVAVKAMTQDTKLVLEKANITLNDIKWVCMHQANSRIIQAIAKGLGLTNRIGRLSRKVPVNIRRYGNTSAASIPILLAEMAESGRLERGDILLLTAAGAGLTSGAAILQW